MTTPIRPKRAFSFEEQYSTCENDSILNNADNDHLLRTPETKYSTPKKQRTGLESPVAPPAPQKKAFRRLTDLFDANVPSSPINTTPSMPPIHHFSLEEWESSVTDVFESVFVLPVEPRPLPPPSKNILAVLTQRERGRACSFSSEAALEKAKSTNKDQIKEVLRCRYIAKQGTFSNLKDQLGNLQEIIDIELMLGNAPDALVVANEMTKVLLQNYQSLQTAGAKPYSPTQFILSKARCYLGLKQYDLAHNLLMEAADLIKSEVILNPHHGFSTEELNQQTNTVDQIIDDLQKIRNQLGIERDFSISLLELIFTLQFAVENYDGAQTSCSEMEDLDPESTSYMRAVIRLVNEQIPAEAVLGPHEDVIGILKSFINRTPENTFTYPDVLFVARLLAKAGKYQSNQRVLQTALEYFAWAKELNDSREFPIKILHDVLSCQCLTVQLDDALQTAQKIYGLQPKNPIPSDDEIVCLLSKIARADESTPQYTDILSDAIALGVAGRDHQDAQILAIALDFFELAKNLNEGKEFPHEVLIELFSFQFADARYLDALETIHKIRACKPDDHEAILEQAIILVRMNQNAKALQLFQEFLSYKATTTLILANLKFAHRLILNLNQPELALAYEAWIAEIESHPTT